MERFIELQPTVQRKKLNKDFFVAFGYGMIAGVSSAIIGVAIGNIGTAFFSILNWLKGGDLFSEHTATVAEWVCGIFGGIAGFIFGFFGRQSLRSPIFKIKFDKKGI